MTAKGFVGFGTVEADVNETDPAVAIQDVAGRHRGDFDEAHEFTGAVVGRGKGQRGIFDERIVLGGGLVDADGDNHHAFRGVISVDLRVAGERGLAGDAPRSKEVDDSNFADGVGHFTDERGGGEWRESIANLEGGALGSGRRDGQRREEKKFKKMRHVEKNRGFARERGR